MKINFNSALKAQSIFYINNSKSHWTLSIKGSLVWKNLVHCSNPHREWKHFAPCFNLCRSDESQVILKRLNMQFSFQCISHNLIICCRSRGLLFWHIKVVPTIELTASSLRALHVPLINAQFVGMKIIFFFLPTLIICGSRKC